MAINYLILFLTTISIAFCYYSLKLNKIYLPVLPNNSIEKNETIIESLDNLEEYVDLPLIYSELNIINESFIPT